MLYKLAALGGGLEFLRDRQYYIISLAIIFLAIAFFMVSFEKKKPREREVVILAVLTAIAVVGRVIFFMVPQFKPCAAVVIIVGVMLGKQAGFLCGALTAFVSDFFFGQGPWTPWQMVALGLIGFLAAMLFYGKRESLANNKWILCGFGFLATFVLYGLLMDTATVFMQVKDPSPGAFIAAYISGIVFNLIHGISTVVFLWILSPQLIKKIKRIKMKYGVFLHNKNI